MTLPFVSYGGSSLISLAYGMGMLVALTRDRPRAKLGHAPVGMTAAASAPTSTAPAPMGAA
jgi:cell division protein FtsW